MMRDWARFIPGCAAPLVLVAASAARPAAPPRATLDAALQAARKTTRPVLVVACDGGACFLCRSGNPWGKAHPSLGALLPQFEVAVVPVCHLDHPKAPEGEADSFRLNLTYPHEFRVLDHEGRRVLGGGYVRSSWALDQSIKTLEGLAVRAREGRPFLPAAPKGAAPPRSWKVPALHLLAAPPEEPAIREDETPRELAGVIRKEGPYGRYLHLRALAASSRADLAPVALRFLDDQHPGVRAAASHALRVLGDRDTLERAASLIRSRRIPSVASREILDGLIEQKSPVVLPWLVEAIETSPGSSRADIRRLTALALDTGDRRALHGLILPLFRIDPTDATSLEKHRRLLEGVAPAIRKLSGGLYRWKPSLSRRRQLAEIEKMKRWYNENWTLLGSLETRGDRP